MFANNLVVQIIFVSLYSKPIKTNTMKKKTKKTKQMKTFKIPVVWQVYGICHVEANSREEAKEKALGVNTPLPEGNYIDDSMTLDEESIIADMNK